MRFEIEHPDRNRIAKSIQLMRKIRGAVLDSDGISAQNALFHASDLAFRTAQLALALDTKDVARLEIDESLKQNELIYGMRDQIARYGHKETWTIGQIQNDIRELQLDWKATIENKYNTLNEITQTGKALLTQEMAIVAPLSSDYLRATVHRTYITEVLQEECFDLIPAAVAPMSERVVFPMKDTKASVTGYKEIGVYIDVISGQGKTEERIKKGLMEHT